MIPRSDKINNLKEIKFLIDYIQDLEHSIKTQYPQPNGNIYLYGLVITRFRVNEAIRRYNYEVTLRKSYDPKCTYELKKSVQKIEKRLREKPIPPPSPVRQYKAVKVSELGLTRELGYLFTEIIFQSEPICTIDQLKVILSNMSLSVYHAEMLEKFKALILRLIHYNVQLVTNS